MNPWESGTPLSWISPNSVSEIQKAFDPFYTATALSEPTDWNGCNLRGFHEEPEDKSPLDEIIRVFNERWFSAWDATPEEQRIKLITILRHVKKSEKYASQVVNNPDHQNRRIALESLIGEAINRERRRELDLYKLYAGDAEFKP